MSKKPVIGISSCVLGNLVRYDGGHTHVDWVTQKLQHYCELKAICPEMEMGLGSPRETMNLVRTELADVRLITSKTKKDLTRDADLSIEKILNRDTVEICGHIFQQRSPSCGLNLVKLYSPDDQLITSSEKNIGLYAKAFTKRFPLVPVIEADALLKSDLREQFLVQVYATFRFNSLTLTLSELREFHRRYELLLNEHDQIKTAQLKEMVSQSSNASVASLFEQYKILFIETLRLIPTPENRNNTLKHLLGELLSVATPEEGEKFNRIFNDYQLEIISYYEVIQILACTLVNQKKFDFIANGFLFDPFPFELL
jgi:uncharacterized protein YbbK (DUF523 family)/uncharacterized protein YbgA (DUF1722 family)